MTPDTVRIEEARREVERTRRQLASTLGALQYRLKPANLMSDAWDGVREKTGEAADGALQAVKDRPMVASGIVAAVALFVARGPLWRLASGLLREDEGAEIDSGTVRADLDHHDKDYDLTAPVVKRPKKEGVTA